MEFISKYKYQLIAVLVIALVWAYVKGKLPFMKMSEMTSTDPTAGEEKGVVLNPQDALKPGGPIKLSPVRVAKKITA